MRRPVRVLSMLLCCALLFGLAGCASGKAAGGSVACINCTVDGGRKVPADGSKHTAVVDLKEGKVLDHWEINGITEESTADVLEFTADFTGYVKAMLRPEKTVTAVNARFRVLDADGNPSGEELTRKVFEHERGVTGSGETAEGIISLEVTAEVPKDCAVYCWKLNGAEFSPAGAGNTLTVRDLTESMTIEPVFMQKTAEDEKTGGYDYFDGGFSPPETENNGDGSHVHDFKEVMRTSPTCMSNGMIIYHCDGCGEDKLVAIPALGHEWETYIDGSGVQHTRCHRCGYDPKG